MSVFFILFPLSFFLALIGLGAYVYAAKSGQFDDLDGPPQRLIHDHDDERK